ncbi:cell division protein SepF [Neosynechococcus sphagnicola sy1]|uniref:Cell division protein SepF n=1 Tax=Neosynechococcus sphagnicola sy1 TaxID=1497020 RepID=A0A098TKQ9_9CYAN|nr:cell division protein SepF [Neosynechococcus sphagnicola]KGF72874.1 cell division protein SepF [Neosynechococcus sphagnicola sy1]
MNNIFTKLRDFVGLNDSAEYDYDYDETTGEEYPQSPYRQETAQTEEESQSRRRMARSRVAVDSEVGLGVTMNNVIGMPRASNGVPEVVIMEPRSFEEMPQAIQALRERKSIILNLNMMDPDQAQRAVDFVAGGTYAIDGHQERIGESIFLFTPNCVQVSTQSGVAHEAAPAQVRVPRPQAPAPAWVSEPSAMMA